MRYSSDLGLSRGDSLLLFVVVVLLALSVLMVFSTTAVSSEGESIANLSIIKRHLAHIILGIGFGFIASRINPFSLGRFAPYFGIFGILVLIFVLIPGLGHRVGGAQRWFIIGSLGIQPGELCKLSVILLMSWYIGCFHEKMASFVSGVIIPLAGAGLYSCLLLLQPDFGTTVVIFCVVMGQLLTATRIRYLIGLGLFGVSSFALLVMFSPYRMRRLLAFLDPFSDPSSSGYQLIQSLIAVGTGGILGLGLGAGKQKLYYLPAAHTDFIYAVIAEELGLVGSLGVMVLFIFILYRGIQIAIRLSSNPFLCSFAVGLTLLIVVPALLNMGVVSGLLPTKGLVLPLIAYGGTAMIVHLIAVGMLFRLSRIKV